MGLNLLQTSKYQFATQGKGLGVVVIFLICLVVLQVFSSSDYDQIYVTMRILLNLVGPIMVLVIYLLFGIILLEYKFIQRNSRQIILFSFVLSIFGIFFAITLNTRSLYLVISLFALGVVDINQAQFVIIAIIAPVIEEFVKIYPLIIFGMHFQTNKEGKKIRFIQHPQLFLIIAVIAGGIFNMLETYWYSWRVGSIANIDNPEDWAQINFQLILRAINPLHITSTLISALGIIVAFQASDELVFTRNSFRIFLPYYFGAVFLHGLWNASTLIFPNQDIVYGLPVFNVILLPLSFIGFILILLRYRKYDASICPICNLWHYTGLNHTTDQQLDDSIVKSFSSSPVDYLCRNCKNPKPNKECEFCQVTEVFSCSNCNYPLPIFAYQCWKCENKVKTIFDNLMDVDDNSVQGFYKGIYFFFSITYIVQFLINLVIIYFNEGGELDVPTYLVLFFIISTALFIGIYLNLNVSYQVWGNIISRYMVGLIMVLITILMLTVGLFLVNIFTASGIFLIFVALIYGLIASKILIPQKVYVGSSF